jgi:hypothetical protein
LSRGASGNVLAGFAAGYWVTTGNDNIILGNYPVAGSANNVTTGNRNILIGRDVRAPNPAGDDQLNIGNLIYGTNLGQGTTLSTGRVGIGNYAPQSRLHVSSETSDMSVFMNSTAGGLRFVNTASTNYIQSGSSVSSTSSADLAFSNMGATQIHMVIRANGNIEINHNLNVGQSIRATAFTYSSDRRLKHDIKTYQNGLGQILKLRGVEFTWNKDDQQDIGFIAQEVEKVEPRLVTKDQSGFKAVKYGNIIAIIVEAIKELDQKLKMLIRSDEDKRREISSLKMKLQEQRDRRKSIDLDLAELRRSCQ